MSAISFTPVKVEPSILDLHLRSLELQGVNGHLFYDDNDNVKSSEMLHAWCDGRENAVVLPKIDTLPPAEGYERKQDTHDWSQSAVERVSMIKNHAIAAFLSIKADYLVLIDADVVPAPVSMLHMTESELPILCGIYWTKWFERKDFTTPNVWDTHPTKFVEPSERFLEPGHYEVGGLGAFTAIHRDVLATGLVNFHAVPGVGYFGEDRHFCIRAAVLGFPLTACSHVHVRHVYRPSDIEPTRDWWEEITDESYTVEG